MDIFAIIRDNMATIIATIITLVFSFFGYKKWQNNSKNHINKNTIKNNKAGGDIAGGNIDKSINTSANRGDDKK